MFKVRVIPCLDVKDGRVVKGVRFLDLRDAGDPVEAAIAYDAAGADELTFLDITASHENRDIILDVVRRTAEACFMPLTVGGGVRTVEDIRRLLASGADKVSINTAAVLIETLSAPASSSLRMSSTVRTPPPTVSGMKQASAVRRTTSSRIPLASWLAVMSRKQSSSAPAAS